MFRTVILASAALFAVTISAAQAADVPDSSSVTVNIADLNLAHASDAQVLAIRIADAAKQVCVSTGHQNDLADCEQYAVANAISSIENELDHNVRTHLISNASLVVSKP